MCKKLPLLYVIIFYLAVKVYTLSKMEKMAMIDEERTGKLGSEGNTAFTGEIPSKHPRSRRHRADTRILWHRAGTFDRERTVQIAGWRNHFRQRIGQGQDLQNHLALDRLDPTAIGLANLLEAGSINQVSAS